MRDAVVDRSWVERAWDVLPGGVSTNVRLADGEDVFVADRARGARVWDAGGEAFLDFVCGFGAVLLGYAHAEVNAALAGALGRGQQFGATHTLEIRLAEALGDAVPSLEMVRFSSTGSEAVHAALRLARFVTGRRKVLKFEGHYHGWLDGILISTHPPEPAGPGREAVARLDSGGMFPHLLDGVLLAPWNDVAILERLLNEQGQDVAAVIMEPVMCNDGCIEPQPGFLSAARELCDLHGCVLVFDEVITGFRLGLGGAQERYDVRPDLSIFGKTLGAGIPVGVVGGRRDLMAHFGTGQVNHSGTYNGNTAAAAAGLATLSVLREAGDAFYDRLYATGRRLIEGLRQAGRAAGVDVHVQGPGPVFWMWVFPDGAPPRLRQGGEIRTLSETVGADERGYERFRRQMRRRGIRLMPGGRWYVSAAHTDEDVAQAVGAAEASLAAVFEQG